MGQFLQSYGIWVFLGIILLFFVIRMSYSAGRQKAGQSTGHSHNGENGTGADPNKPTQHGGCC